MPCLSQMWREAGNPALNLRKENEIEMLQKIAEAIDGLKAIGWAESSYCPKDGSVFLAIEAGSTGIFRCHYTGEWPKGTWWLEDGGDLWPSRPILWKPLPKDAP